MNLLESHELLTVRGNQLVNLLESCELLTVRGNQLVNLLESCELLTVRGNQLVNYDNAGKPDSELATVMQQLLFTASNLSSLFKMKSTGHFNSFITVGRFSGAADLLPLSPDFLLEA